jgi:hypothetical protein
MTLSTDRLALELAALREARARSGADLAEAAVRLHAGLSHLCGVLRVRETRDDPELVAGAVDRLAAVGEGLGRILDGLRAATGGEFPDGTWNEARELEWRSINRREASRRMGAIGGAKMREKSQKQPIQRRFLVVRQARPREGIGEARARIATEFQVPLATVERYTKPSALRAAGLLPDPQSADE